MTLACSVVYNILPFAAFKKTFGKRSIKKGIAILQYPFKIF